MFSLNSLVLTIGAAAALVGPKPDSRQPDPLRGSWRNPSGSVTMRIDACGERLCGVVTAASADAIDDAKAAGSDHLVGMRLFDGYRRDGVNHWSGEAFVPDLNRRFASHIVLVDHDHARVAGCLIGLFLCQSQIWQRQ